MGYGVSIFLLAVGAILTWAVHTSIEGVNLETIGVILMVVGAIGLLFSLLFLSSFGMRRRSDGTVVERDIIQRDVV